MAFLSSSLRIAVLACSVASFQTGAVLGAEPPRIVFQNGRSVPISAVTLQGASLVVNVDTESYNAGQTIPFESADHIYGEQPPELKQATALITMDKSREALVLLEPIVTKQRITSKIPGNFWVDAARAMLVAYAVTGNAAKCAEIGKDISDATPAQGSDPFVALGKALLMPRISKPAEFETGLSDLAVDNPSAEVAAYASFFLGNLYKETKRNAKALEAYLAVPCLFPTGGLVLTSAAEIQAADLLSALKRPDESLQLVKSAKRGSVGTPLDAEAQKRLDSLK
jgi:hypothetical protein